MYKLLPHSWWSRLSSWPCKKFCCNPIQKKAAVGKQTIPNITVFYRISDDFPSSSYYFTPKKSYDKLFSLIETCERYLTRDIRLKKECFRSQVSFLKINTWCPKFGLVYRISDITYVFVYSNEFRGLNCISDTFKVFKKILSK
jgi:hypothetical protein